MICLYILGAIAYLAIGIFMAKVLHDKFANRWAKAGFAVAITLLWPIIAVMMVAAFVGWGQDGFH